MKKKNAINLKFNKLKIKCAYKVTSKNMLKKFVHDNSNNIEDLNNEVRSILKNKWIYIKNKKVYYNTELCSLFPDLLTFTIGFCPIRKEFNDDSIRLRFGQYDGRIMTYSELLKVLDDKGCIQNIAFYNYTVFLNGIKFIDINNREVVNSFNDAANPYLSYHIPIYELSKNRTIIDENGYDLKYVDEGIRIEKLYDIINLWFDYELIPEGLTEKSEKLYASLMEMSKLKFNKYKIKYRGINIIH